MDCFKNVIKVNNKRGIIVNKVRRKIIKKYFQNLIHKSSLQKLY